MLALLLLVSVTPEPTPDVARKEYDQRREELENERKTLSTRYDAATSSRVRSQILEEARREVLEALTQTIFPAWKGTTWAFSGTSNTPGEGQIACGFFVGTVLEHAGFRLDRIALGRLASEHIALSLTRNKNLRRWSDAPAKDVIREVESWGPGLYAVGLDLHAGLIWVDEAKAAWFVHSTYVADMAVMIEPLDGDNPFTWSRYRVVARLLDDEMMRRWLKGHWFEAKKTR